MSNNYQLQWLLNCLDDLKDDQEKIKSEIFVTTDVLRVKRLERNLDAIFKSIEDLENEIQQQKNNLIQKKFDNLIQIIPSDHRLWEQIQQAYQNTISHWPTGVRQNVHDVGSIIAELNKIAQGSCEYSALDEFVATIFSKTSDMVLINSLTQWGKEYCENMDWLSLYGEIQDSRVKNSEESQPAILIAIARNDEASTQAQDGENYYQLESWLIKDVKTYQAKKTGYQSLLNDNTVPCLLTDLLDNISVSLDRFLQQQRDHCPGCENYPEIHVFLPLELMYLGVDIWVLGNRARPEYLGHEHLVFIHCANRYDRNYNKTPSWKKLWKRHQKSLQETAWDVLVPGHDRDLDDLRDILENWVKPNALDSNIVGLYVTDPPVSTENLVDELLDTGLPVAIWSRHSLVDGAHQVQMSALLTACSLAALPDQVKNKRREVHRRQDTKDVHIGHHVSLLWDDPNFYPPKSA